MAKVPEFLSRFKLNYSLLSLVLAAIILVEGAAVMVMSRQIDLIQNWGSGLYQGTVTLAGAQLFLLGLAAVACVVLNGELFAKVAAVRKVRSLLFRDRAFLFPLFKHAPAVIGAAVALEGLVVAYYASPMVVTGLGNVRGMWLAVFGAQLFMLGAGLAAARVLDGRLNLQLLVRSAVLLAFASLGVLIYGLASRASITGIGGIQESTVELLGIQMAALALLGIALLCLGDLSLLRRKLFGWKLGTLGVIAVSAVLCFEGMVLASVAAPFTLASIGGMRESTMLLAGVLIAVLAMMVPASYFFLEKRDMNVRKLGYASMLFLFFMLPFAILM
jgi:hypothetical protein